MFLVDRSCKVNTASREHLVTTVVCAAKKSQRLLRQLYSLQDFSMPGSLDVPAIDLFKTDGQMSAGPEAQNENLRVDVNCIRDIIRLNAFGGADLREWEFSGLWLLPSFINHSCLPNSRWLDVGSAKFIHATKPIERGEEITIRYFDALVPLAHRQAMCKNWGFKCNCRRCILEHFFRTSLKPIIFLRFVKLHEKVIELIAGRSCLQLSDVDLRERAELARLLTEAEEIIQSSHVLKTEEEKRWIRASSLCAYHLSTMLNGCFPSRQKLIEDVKSTVPGDIRNLYMAAGLLKSFQRWMADENEAFITRHASDQAREACICVFGRHSEDVLKALVLRYSNCDGSCFNNSITSIVFIMGLFSIWKTYGREL